MIRPRGSKQQVRVYAGRKNGRDVYIHRTAATLKEAKSIERALEKQVEDNRHPQTNMTLTELLDRWLEHATPDLAATTLRTYRGYIDRTIVPAIGSTKLGKLSPAVLDDFYGDLRDTVAPATIRQIHAIIRRACSVAVRWGYLGVNPASNARPPRVLRSEHSPPGLVEARKFLAGLDADLAMFVRLAAASGARRGELCALRWTDVNLAIGSMTVARSLSAATSTPVEKDTKTHQVRRLQLGAGTVSRLTAHLEAEREKAEWARVPFDDRGFVFTSLPGRPWHPDAIGKRYRKAANAAGLTKVRLHDWRHWAATNAIAGGHPVRQVADRLGHASTKMTHDTYSHVVPAGDQAIADTLDDLLDG